MIRIARVWPRVARDAARPQVWSGPRWRLLGLGAAGLLLVGLFASSLGAVPIPFLQVGGILLDHLPGVHLYGSWPESWDTIVWSIRLPRVVLAGVVGAALALSGATYQGMFRNPLADPYLIGVAAGAGLGATLILALPLPGQLYTTALVPFGAFVGALLVVSLAYSLARMGGSVPITSLVLAGVALGALASAGISLLIMMTNRDVRSIVGWLLGGFATAGWQDMLLVWPYFLPSAAVILFHGRILNVLQLDEEQARQLGVNVEWTKLLLVGAASLATAAAVSVSGLIGFVGLIIPHAARLLFGHDYRTLLPVSLLLGAGFLVLADLAARTLFSPAEMPVGVITAFCGTPFFLYLLRRSKRGVF